MGRIIDASVHVFFKNNDDIRGHMREPYKSRGFPDYEKDWYGAPGGEYVPWAEAPGLYPGSDPGFAGRQLFAERGVALAILHPMTRGLLPDRHLASAIAAAHNEMLVHRWLEHEAYGERFRGTIRVVPDDIDGALKELARWKDHPRVVQVGVPMQSHVLYGKPRTGRCGRRPPRRASRSRCTSRQARGSSTRRPRPGRPAPSRSTTASWR